MMGRRRLLFKPAAIPELPAPRDGGMTSAEEVAAKRAKMIEHLENAQRLANEINDPMADYMINMALMTVRESEWPPRK
jgi:hypothetical protein